LRYERSVLALQALTAEELVRSVEGLRPDEARRIVSAVNRGLPVDVPFDQVRKLMITAVRAAGHVPTLAIKAVEASSVDAFAKLALLTHDDRVIEAVRIPLEDPTRASACVSSQVGCALACSFCATGRMGFFRNLEIWEIVEQVRLLRHSEGLGLPRRIHGVVFQGMGEPLLNLDRVIAAIRVMSQPSGLAIDMKAMTVCTSGIPDGIRRMAVEVPRVRLGVSIGNARREKRSLLMPVERLHSLDDTLEAAAFHAKTTGLKPMVAYTPLDGVNDSDEDADALAEVLQRFAVVAGTSARLSVIPYNRENDADPYRRQTPERRLGFLDALRARGLHPHERYSGSGDIAAACGQLAARGENGQGASMRKSERDAVVSPKDRAG
jgi:23S rRNA (adenine2503-C2)-methyltransferase